MMKGNRCVGFNSMKIDKYPRYVFIKNDHIDDSININLHGKYDIK